ncbi:response regulator [Brevibacillus choshinensis]|uniref:Response regulator n=1 Tax=Brevibacillus choshinensis TaxID=54911 RepID=A0ABX7FRK1_BRECH|nr:response regulator [Brevibacillus choshinensis]QRG67630.1 response regulator [Brevibacillus choshinensis]
MFNALIVEDEKPILDLMKYVIGQDPHYTIVGAFTNPLEALAEFPEHSVDVAFLDIEMPKMNGLELAQKINECSAQTKIVFTTAYKDYALDAFNLFAFHYILKPVTPMAIDRVTKKLVEQLGHIKTGGQPQNKATIQCFGGFEVRNQEGNMVRWRTKKAEELFAYFLCHPGRHVSKWNLIDLLWGEMDEERATHNLYTTVYRLKKILKEQKIGVDIHKTSEGYVLEPRDQSYDVWAYLQHNFPQTREPFDVEQAEYLYSQYKGPLLDQRDYFWKTPMEEMFAKQYTMLVQQLIEHDLFQREWQKAEQRVDSYLSMYPLQEEMNQILLEMYARNKQSGKVAKHYEKFAHAYRNEVGVEPPEGMRKWVAAYLKENS